MPTATSAAVADRPTGVALPAATSVGSWAAVGAQQAGRGHRAQDLVQLAGLHVDRGGEVSGPAGTGGQQVRDTERDHGIDPTRQDGGVGYRRDGGRRRYWLFNGHEAVP